MFKFFLFAALYTVSVTVNAQSKVCESNPEDFFVELNTIGKCAIDKFKNSNKREFVSIATRNRYKRKRSHATATIKRDVKSISEASSGSFIKPVIKKVTSTEVIKPAESNTKFLKIQLKQEIELKEVVTKSGVSIIKDFVAFDNVSEIPVFISCSSSVGSNEDCVKETFVNNILENLIYPFDAASEGIEGKVWVRFIIDKDGYIKNVTAKGPENGQLLEQEAKRLITMLPKFMPGKHEGSFVNVEYFLPIDFQLDDYY